jgi:1,4-alpha-glucan branching enzyme
LGEHPDWGTLIFNYGRHEVRNFLIANALFWLEEFHADALRVDAVASMLYLDYSRERGQWLPNKYGGRENIEAIEFLRQLNATVRHEHPGCAIIAEESTAWPGVTDDPQHGLGFEFKWNMGWMHDTLRYFALDGVHRRWHQHELTFAMLYEGSENYVMPLSHDEVVHGKGSLLNKMAGDEWQKFANLRTLLTYMMTRPGKKLLFMGTELAPWTEWSHDGSLDWNLLADDPRRARFSEFIARLNALYRERSELWRRDDQRAASFAWIAADDRDNSVLSYQRFEGERHVIVVLNLTPVPREQYRIGAPANVVYREMLNSDASEWGGSGFPTKSFVRADAIPLHGNQHSIELTLPPLAALVLAPEPADPSLRPG